jgi:ADP-heptose:LPS heptosyltransferase
MKIAVLRALQLGDLLCSVPALRALRCAYPDAHVTLIGLPWARELAGRLRRHVNGFLEFPGFMGMPERRPRDLPAFFDAVRARFDLAIQLHGSGLFTNPFTALMRPREMAGFYQRGEWCPDRARFLEWRPEEHEVLRWLRLLEQIGVPAKGTQLEFPLAEADWAEQRALRLGDYAVIHAGSQLPSRRWPPERFAEVGDALAMEGLQVVLTGLSSEKKLTGEVRKNMRQHAADLAGRTSLGGLAAVVAKARMVVCNDTGISHVAAATGTPSVVIACGSDPRRWAPLNAELHRVLFADVSCRPCMHTECPIGHPCALGVHAAHVVEAARKALVCAA